VSGFNSTYLAVSAEECGLRLDQFFARRLPQYSRVQIQKAFELGHVFDTNHVLDKGKQSQKVSTGQQFRIEIVLPEPLRLNPVDMSLKILYEDEDIIVIDKAAGHVVHPSPGHFDESIVHGLLAHCQSTLSSVSGVERPGIVHRLDQFTTGVMVVAKHDQAHRALSTQFAQRTVHKTYWAIVHKTPAPPVGRIETLMGRHPNHPLRMAVSLTQGKHAITRYRTQCTSGLYSVLECFPETGRTHQIRVHLAHIGHKIIGDPLYGRAHIDLSRQGLHAKKLEFMHPTRHHVMRINSPIPEDMQQFIQKHIAPETA
jgi:23S rRNA pseudouridine1911/1915/1917 synthase